MKAALSLLFALLFIPTVAKADGYHENYLPISPVVRTVKFTERTFKLTFYSCSIQEGTQNCRTRTGHKATYGVAASSSLPLGTVVYIENLGTYTILDTGRLDQDHIDIWVPSREEAFRLGVRYEKVRWEEFNDGFS